MDVSQSLPATFEEHCTVVAKVRKFSDLPIHNPYEMTGEFTAYETSSDYFKEEYSIAVYPNGHEISTQGFVSIVFCAKYFLQAIRFGGKHIEMTCLISVIDSEGDRRLLQSFVFFRDHAQLKFNPYFIIDSYVPRSVLLETPSEYLPGDTLILHTDVILRERRFENILPPEITWKIASPAFTTEEGPDGPRHYLSLDTSVAKRLAEASAYFSRMMDIPMIEKTSRRTRIPDEERVHFRNIGDILMNGDYPILADSIADVFDLYVIADKYGIAFVVETCRNWLKVFLSKMNAAEISEFAYRYQDDSLREIVRVFLETGDGGDFRSPAAAADSGTEETGDCETGSGSRCSLSEEVEDGNEERCAFNFYS